MNKNVATCLATVFYGLDKCGQLGLVRNADFLEITIDAIEVLDEISYSDGCKDASMSDYDVFEEEEEDE